MTRPLEDNRAGSQGDRGDPTGGSPAGRTGWMRVRSAARRPFRSGLSCTAQVRVTSGSGAVPGQAIQRRHDLSPRSKAGRRDGSRWSGSFHSPSVALATFAAGAGLWLRQSWPGHDAPNPLPERCDRRGRVRVATDKELPDSFLGKFLAQQGLGNCALPVTAQVTPILLTWLAEAFRRELGTKATQRDGPRCGLQVVVRNACGRYGSLASGLREFENPA